MRAVVRALGVTALGLLAPMLTTSMLGDRSVLASPPDARVEGFTRLLAAHRPTLAWRYLSDERRRTVTPALLARSFEALDFQLDGVDNVEAQPIRVGNDTAAARSELVGRQARRVTLEFKLTWERGQWAISELPAALTPASVDGSGRPPAPKPAVGEE